MMKILKRKENRDVSADEVLQPTHEGKKTVGETGEIPTEETENAERTEETGEPELAEMGTQKEPSLDPVEKIATEGFSEEVLSEIDQYASQEGISPESREKVTRIIREIGEAWKTGELTLDHFKDILRSVEYDDSVAKAFSNGELKGRNEQIEEKYMCPEESDGLPHPFGGGIAAKSRDIASIFDLARNAG